MVEPLNLREQIAISVSLAEGQFREFKTAQSGPPGSKSKRPIKDICKDVGEALVAFANSDGGELLIGVEDDGEITGLNNFSVEEINSIKGASRTHVHPDTPLQSVLSRDTVIDSKTVVYFRIAKGTQRVHLTSDGRCLRRNDLETIPVPPEQIQFARREVLSREYDREFVNNASVADLDQALLKITAQQISPGISVDRCLQYLGLAEYDSNFGLRLRRAALLLFAKTCDQWHPRVQVRIIKINGTSLGAGEAYATASDVVIKHNIVRLIDEAWDHLRQYLVVTHFAEDARFRTTHIYPEIACRETLTNAIAHRDYSEEGRGIEIYVFDDRIEITNPGGLLSTMSLSELKSLKGTHQSRNSYIARTLREIGYMRELGEGMRRIFELMKSNELAPPEIATDQSTFTISLHHRPMYNKDETLWLSQYDGFQLSREEKAVLLIGRRGDLISTNDIIRRLGLVDIEDFRKILASLQEKRLIESVIKKNKAVILAKQKKLSIRDFPRFRIRAAKDASRAKEVADSQHDASRHFENEESASTGPAPKGGTPAPGKRTIKGLDTEQFIDSQSEDPEEQDLKLYVGNVPPNTTRRDILAAFLKIGTPLDIVIPQHNGLSKGFAFVEFSDPATAKAALKAEIKIGGRLLTIRRKLPQRSQLE